MSNELTVGTPLDMCDGPLPEGWTEVDCPVCDKPMRCREENATPKKEGDTVALICYHCFGSMIL